jgi:hypothetical protein
MVKRETGMVPDLLVPQRQRRAKGKGEAREPRGVARLPKWGAGTMNFPLSRRA